MRNTKLSELQIAPEEYEQLQYEKIDWSDIHSEMLDIERRFINGLIKYYEPRKILEIGVYAGGGTVNILNAISQCKDAVKCISVDHAGKNIRECDADRLDYYAQIEEVGRDVRKAFGDLPVDRWQLITEKDPSEVMDDIGGKIDFVIIDTDHSHPIESLNFLCVLPYLEDGAIVVLHDVWAFYVGWLAPRILMSVLASEKLDIKKESNRTNNSNIVALQINSDTLKYIQNVFDALFIPWQKMPDESDIQSIRKHLINHYSKEQLCDFDKAVAINKELFISGMLSFTRKSKRITDLLSELKTSTDDAVIFYGAGLVMTRFLASLKSTQYFDFTLNAQIWDINAEKIGSILGFKVILPDFETRVTGRIAIIMIVDSFVANEVRDKLMVLGYTVFHGIGEYAAGV